VKTFSEGKMDWDSKEFYAFLSNASIGELYAYYDSTTNGDRKLVCAGYCMGKYNKSIRTRQLDLFNEEKE
jgi:hypothetical protein